MGGEEVEEVVQVGDRAGLAELVDADGEHRFRRYAFDFLSFFSAISSR